MSIIKAPCVRGHVSAVLAASHHLSTKDDPLVPARSSLNLSRACHDGGSISWVGKARCAVRARIPRAILIIFLPKNGRAAACPARTAAPPKLAGCGYWGRVGTTCLPACRAEAALRRRSAEKPPGNQPQTPYGGPSDSDVEFLIAKNSLRLTIQATAWLPGELGVVGCSLNFA
jgi:hypothetical protein